MTSCWKLFATAAGLLCLSAAAQEKPANPAEPAQVIVAPLSAPVAAPTKSQPARSFLWEVKSATATVYLFGTVHVGRSNFYPLADVVEVAFAASDRLAVEADITDQKAVMDSAPLMMYAPPDSLEKRLTPMQLIRLKSRLKRYNIPFEAVKGLKPFIVGGLLAVSEFGRLGYEQRYGVDTYLINKAVQRGKPVVELESVAAQMELLAGLPHDEQLAFLENALITLDRGGSEMQINGMIYAWQNGDPAHMERVVREANEGMPLTEKLDEKMLYGRNGPMAKRIEGFLAGKEKTFVAVGSMHLVGKRGLVEMLKSRGYAVQQL